MKKTNVLFLMLIVTLFVLFSCSEDSTGPDNVKPGTPSNPNPEDNAAVISLTPTLSWECIDPEGDSLTYDVYFGISSNPPLVNSSQNETSYDPSILNAETIYYWKIVVSDGQEDTEGDIWEFTTGGFGTVTDIDGNVYSTLIIGEQEWMTENLKVTHYRNGDVIPYITQNVEWQSLSTGAFGVYDNIPANAETYGNLYNWYAVDDSRNIAPEGWHVPTDEEIKELEMALGMSENEANECNYRGTNEGSKLAGSADLWCYGDLENNAEFGTSGFSFLPGGYRNDSNGVYDYMSYFGFLWSSSECESEAWMRYLHCSITTVYRGYNYKRYGFSVRCIKDSSDNY